MYRCVYPFIAHYNAPGLVALINSCTVTARAWNEGVVAECRPFVHPDCKASSDRRAGEEMKGRRRRRRKRRRRRAGGGR